MKWNIAPECISMVVLCIIWIYSRKSNLTPTLKNILFQGCFVITFIAGSTNILSTVLILNYEHMSALTFTWVVTTIYFAFTPLMGLIYHFYSASVIYEGKKNLRNVFLIWAIPSIMYMLLVVSNPYTKLLFDFTAEHGYSQGPLIMVTYIVFYFYCLTSLIFVIRNRRTLSPEIYHILSVFPVIAVVVIVIQQIFPTLILTGSAASCALLIIYLHLQNRQISIDYITNLPNRLELLDMLDLLIRKPKQPFALIIVSLRGFKQINDTFGQQNGDYLLKTIGKYLVTLCEKNCVFRFKGDEFALLLKGNVREKWEHYISEIMNRLSQSWEINDTQCIISCAIGIVDYPETAQTLENLILSAEGAITRAKRDGYNRTCYFNKNMFSILQRKKIIIQILREKLETKDFEMYYQPIISLQSGKFEYAESLMRITNSPLGFISPGEFIPIAEETGMIVDFTYLILDKVCQFIQEIQRKKLTLHCVHVNFSALQFKQTNLTKKVMDIITHYDIPPSSIKIEFTESTVAENTDYVTQFAIDMEKHGIYMGLDDFGVGYSNLSTVINIPFSTAKLDKSLVYAAMKEEKFSLTVQNLIRIFKDLDMIVIVEGVETEAQNQFIISSGADQIQGFYYAKPMPVADMELFLANQK